MSHQVRWSAPIIAEFLNIGALTQKEKEVFLHHVNGLSIIEIAFRVDLSESAVNKYIKRIKLKYDNACRHSNILPERSDSNVWK